MWRMSSCCGGDEVTQVDIHGDGMTIGLVGLRQIFDQFYALGLEPNDPIGDQLLAMIKARNYVSRSAEQAYKAALLREYAAFCTEKQQ